MSSRRHSMLVVLALAVLAFSAGIALLGCGKEQSKSSPVIPASAAELQFPAPAPGEQPYTNVSTVSDNVLDRLLGTYDTILEKNSKSQPVKITLSITNIEGTNIEGTNVEGQDSRLKYAFMKLESDGELGSIRLEAFLGMGFNGIYNYRTNSFLYSFASAAKTVTTLADLPMSIQMILTLKNGTTFDPTQSKIYIKDCGFSQGVVCSSDAPGVHFKDNALAKR
jgi:hypothetical protein